MTRAHLFATLVALLTAAGAIGVVDGSPIPHAPHVDSPQFGKSMDRSPTILRLHIGGEGHDILDPFGPVEAKAKSAFFSNTPPFVFNVVAAVGEAGLTTPGVYGDPTSPWFNVFLGYYQIDVDKTAWDRPFAYANNQAEHSAPNFEELVRLGKADWNYFSNWMYGVPEQYITPHNNIEPIGFYKPHFGVTKVGQKTFHTVEIENVTVVSAYESNAPGAAQLVDNAGVFSPLFREVFGLPHPRPEFTTSFVPTTMKARFYMAYFQDAEKFHTVMFGGVANQARADADALLTAELDAVAEVITSHYSDLGWNDAGGELHVPDLSGAAGSEQSFSVEVPAGATNLDINILGVGGTGDADLYVNLDSAATTTNYICRPYASHSNESCTFEPAIEGTYHIMVRGYSAYSGVTLSATWDWPDPTANSCEGYCGGQAPSGCYCDPVCVSLGDCCEDKIAVCG